LIWRGANEETVRWDAFGQDMGNVIREQVFARNKQSKKDKARMRDAAAAEAAASGLGGVALSSPEAAQSVTDTDLAGVDDRRLLEELARRARTRRLGGS